MASEVEIVSVSSALREELGLGDAPVGDITGLVRDAGYEYMEEPLRPEVSGFSKRTGGGTYVIGFNADHHWNEGFRRFTVAHELAHVTIPDHPRILDGGEVHFSRSEFQNHDEVIEREADRFAVNFLTPERAFRKRMEFKEYCPATVFALADHFGTSAQNLGVCHGSTVCGAD